MTAGVTIRDFSPVIRNSLRDFAIVELPSGMVVHDVSIHERDGERWGSPPGKPTLSRDGTPLHGADGKLRCASTIAFATRARRNAFSAVIVEALRAQRPEAFR